MHIYGFHHSQVYVLHIDSYIFLGVNGMLPYSAYISRVFTFANFASLESFAKLFQQKFGHFEVEPHWRRKRWLYFSISRRWMETIQGPTYLIHKERSRKKYPPLVFNIRSKHGNCSCTSAISCWRQGQGNVPQDQC